MDAYCHKGACLAPFTQNTTEEKKRKDRILNELPARPVAARVSYGLPPEKHGSWWHALSSSVEERAALKLEKSDFPFHYFHHTCYLSNMTRLSSKIVTILPFGC